MRAEHALRHFLVQRVVVGNQDAQRQRARPASRRFPPGPPAQPRWMPRRPRIPDKRVVERRRLRRLADLRSEQAGRSSASCRPTGVSSTSGSARPSRRSRSAAASATPPVPAMSRSTIAASNDSRSSQRQRFGRAWTPCARRCPSSSICCDQHRSAHRVIVDDEHPASGQRVGIAGPVAIERARPPAPRS